MRIYTLMSITLLIMHSCVIHKNLESSNETLILNQYKMINDGYLNFFIQNNGIINSKLFGYSIDVKNNKVIVSAVENRAAVENKNKVDGLTSLSFRKMHENTWREKYYKCFHESFLEMSNDEKIVLLDSLASLK